MFFLVGLLILINLYIFWKAFVIFVSIIHYYFNYLFKKDDMNINHKWEKFITLFKLNQIKSNLNKKLNHKKSFNDSLNDINMKNHNIYDKLSFNHLKKYKSVIVNIDSEEKYNLKQLGVYFKKNDVKLFFIGDEKPENVKEFFEVNDLNIKNYLSPYNYSKSIFNYVQKNSEGVISDIPDQDVVKNKQFIIDDICSSNNLSKDQFIYIE